jgi:hypothetical protein
MSRTFLLMGKKSEFLFGSKGSWKNSGLEDYFLNGENGS